MASLNQISDQFLELPLVKCTLVHSSRNLYSNVPISQYRQRSPVTILFSSTKSNTQSIERQNTFSLHFHKHLLQYSPLHREVGLVLYHVPYEPDVKLLVVTNLRPKNFSKNFFNKKFAQKTINQDNSTKNLHPSFPPKKRRPKMFAQTASKKIRQKCI